MDNTPIFEQMAARYDNPDRVQTANAIAGAVREIFPARPGGSLLDYGCGTGLAGLAIRDLFDTILFVDASPQMIAQVQQKIDAMGLAGAKTLCADFSEGTPPGLAADCIILAQVLLHVKEPLPLLRTLHGILAPGGHLLIADFDRNAAITSDKIHPGFDQATLAAQLEGIGFASARSRTFYHGQKLMGLDASMFLMDAVK